MAEAVTGQGQRQRQRQGERGRSRGIAAWLLWLLRLHDRSGDAAAGRFLVLIYASTDADTRGMPAPAVEFRRQSEAERQKESVRERGQEGGGRKLEPTMAKLLATSTRTRCLLPHAD